MELRPVCIPCALGRDASVMSFNLLLGSWKELDLGEVETCTTAFCLRLLVPLMSTNNKRMIAPFY